MSYEPAPIDTSQIELPAGVTSLVEKLAENTHEVWAKRRMDEGWEYGPQRNDERRETPCLVPYAKLPESEKDYDRRTATEALKVILALGFDIRPKQSEA